MDGDTWKVIAAVAGIVIIECVALSQGIDGAILMGSFAVIGGMAGYSAKEVIDRYKDGLNGYVRVEVEFKTKKDLDNFIPPPWFAEEITRYNHRIHKNLGEISFNEMKKRFKEKGIKLRKI